MKRYLKGIIFFLLCSVLALVLTVAATLICGVRMLRPEVLTPLVERFANSALDARVTLGRVELSFKPAFPQLYLELDSLTIVSDAFADVDSGVRADLPSYADTLFTLGAFRGELNLSPLLKRGEIAVGEVALVRPALNIVIASNGASNFDIYHPDSVAESAEATAIPPFSIKRFAFESPRSIRYFNAVDSTEATIVLLSDAYVDGHASPRYAVKIDGNVGNGVIRDIFKLDNVAFGLDGTVRWDPALPSMLALEDFSVSGAFVEARMSTSLNFDSTLVVEQARVDVAPIAVSELLAVAPPDIVRRYRLTEPMFSTDATVALNAELLRPFNTVADSIPYARVNVTIPPSSLRYGKAVLRHLALDLQAEARGNNLDSLLVTIENFTASGPATTLNVHGTASRLFTDPAFDVCVKGDIDLRRLPPVLASQIPGYVSGRIIMDVDARGAVSMFEPNEFHKLSVSGKIDGRDLYFLSSDTAKMADIANANIIFDTHGRSRTWEGNTLGGIVKVDTASILINGVNITAGGLSLGAGVENSRRTGDTTLVVPIGGGLKLARLNVENISDSGGVRMRNIAGNVSLRRFRNYKRLPEIIGTFDIGRVAAGTPETRFLLSKAHVDAQMHLKPSVAKNRREIKRLADSLQLARPDLPPDSVYRIVIEKRRHRPKPRHHRVYTKVDSADNEIIEWGLSKGFARFLRTWELSGSLTTRNARLFTPLFPLRNRVRRLDINFNTDSILLNNVVYRAGRSDMTMKGIISNIKRSLTSTTGRQALKVNIDIVSDTIDVNQLSVAAFAGAAYSERKHRGEGARQGFSSDADETELDHQLDALVSEHPDTVGALLVPTNIDASLNLHAKHVLYADLALADLQGDVLMYGGGLNLHNLSASSEAGAVSLSALYSAPKATDMKFGFGLDLQGFKIDRFLKLVPAVDSIMPLMRDFSGIINAQIAATVDIDSTMNMVLPTLDAAVHLSGDSLAFINPDTYRTIGKWLRFRDRADNKIKHLSVELLVKDNVMELFPFTIDIDRYRLGVAGYNDLALNFNYHISVLKSPLPFKFGVTVSGTPEKYKVRLGGAKFKEGLAAERLGMVDTARVNLINQIENVFRRGVQNSRFAHININQPVSRRQLEEPDPVLSASDSLALIREGLIPGIMNDSVPAPQPTPEAVAPTNVKVKKENGRRRKK